MLKTEVLRNSQRCYGERQSRDRAAAWHPGIESTEHEEDNDQQKPGRGRPSQRLKLIPEHVALLTPIATPLSETWRTRSRDWEGWRGSRPGGHGACGIRALAKPRNRAASGQFAAKARRTREVPTLLGFDVRLTDRTAIIARQDGDSNDMKLSNVQVQEFLINQVTPTPIPGVSVVNLRGWGSVDVTMHGGTFRLVTTHLTQLVPGPNPAGIQQVQAAELI